MVALIGKAEIPSVKVPSATIANDVALVVVLIGNAAMPSVKVPSATIANDVPLFLILRA